MRTWSLVVCIALAAIARAAPPNLHERFVAGETLDFDLTWLVLVGGSARMTIGLAPGDPAHLRITSVAATSAGFSWIMKARDEVESIVGVRDFSTVRYEKHLNERGRRKDEMTTFDETRHVATRHRLGKRDQVVKVTQPLFDPLSLVYHLRALELTPGQTQRFTILADGKMRTLETEVTGRETLETAAGMFRCVIVEPKMITGGLFGNGNGKLTIWYSDDARHVPVRIRSDVNVGTITATLREIHEGAMDPEPAK